ncbi:MAG TPA: GAF domain-containing protein, partial [Gemmatimonadales bacterium]|nr:GAF domain-containing protein [Gemmatimonadales bacterium]
MSASSPSAPGILPTEVVAALAQATVLLATPEALFRVIHQQTERIAELDAFYLALWDEATGIVRYVAHHDQDDTGSVGDVPLGEGPTSWVIRHGRTLRFDSREELEALVTPVTFGSERRSASGVHIPLFFGDRVIGVLSAQSYRPGRFPDRIVHALEALAAHAAVALEAGRLARAAEADRQAAAELRAELDRRLSAIEVLRRTSHELARTADAEATMRYVAAEGMRLFSATHAGVSLIDAARRTHRHTVAINLPPAYTETMDRHFFAMPQAPRLLRGEVVAYTDVRDGADEAAKQVV